MLNKEKEEIISFVLEKLKKDYILTRKEEPFLPSNNDILIPTSCFLKNLGSLESLVKFLRETKKLSFTELSKLMNRKVTTVKTAYGKSVKKSKKRTIINKESYNIPLFIFSNRRLTVFEAATVYLKDKGFNYKKIADLLNKDQRNVWSTYTRALTKISKGGKK